MKIQNLTLLLVLMVIALPAAAGERSLAPSEVLSTSSVSGSIEDIQDLPSCLGPDAMVGTSIQSSLEVEFPPAASLSDQADVQEFRVVLTADTCADAAIIAMTLRENGTFRRQFESGYPGTMWPNGGDLSAGETATFRAFWSASDLAGDGSDVQLEIIFGGDACQKSFSLVRVEAIDWTVAQDPAAH